MATAIVFVDEAGHGASSDQHRALPVNGRSLPGPHSVPEVVIRNEMTAMSKRNATHRLCKLAKRGSHIGNRTLIGTDGQQRHPKFLRFSQRPVLNSGDAASL